MLVCVEANCRRKPSGVVFYGGVFFTTEATEGHGETQGFGVGAGNHEWHESDE